MRPLWSGALSFGLINIPIKIYSAAEERGLEFHMLEKGTLCPIGYARVCKHEHGPKGHEVPYKNIVKGYEYRKGDFVVLTDEDFKRANAKKTQTVEIESFVDASDIDSMYYSKPYYLEPDKKAQKAYILLRDALKRSKKVAIARFVMREKEHMAAVRVHGNILILDQLRFPNELRSEDAIEVPKTVKYSAKEMELAMSLVHHLGDSFKPEKFKDTYTDELKRVIKEKAQGKTPKQKGERPRDTKVTDLMAALKASLKQTA